MGREKILLERALVLFGISSITAVAAITVFEVIAGHDGTLAVAAFTNINTIVNLTIIRALTRGRSRKKDALRCQRPRPLFPARSCKTSL